MFLQFTGTYSMPVYINILYTCILLYKYSITFYRELQQLSGYNSLWGSIHSGCLGWPLRLQGVVSSSSTFPQALPFSFSHLLSHFLSAPLVPIFSSLSPSIALSLVKYFFVSCHSMPMRQCPTAWTRILPFLMLQVYWMHLLII